MKQCQLTFKRNDHSRSHSRDKSYTKVNLKRDDPQIKARLDNLVKSASLYKTKACGTMRNQSFNRSTHTNQPSSRVIIEQSPPRKSTSRSLSKRRLSTNSGITQRKQPWDASQQCVFKNYNNQNQRRNPSCSFGGKPHQLQSHKPRNANTSTVTNARSSMISTFRNNSTFSVQSNTSNQSIKPFSSDADFIDFLKNISLYVTGNDSPREDNNKLYKNLEYLRERFKEFKSKKDTASHSYQSDYMHSDRTLETCSFNQSAHIIPPHKQQQHSTLRSPFVEKTHQVINHSHVKQSAFKGTPKQMQDQLKTMPEKQRKQIEFIDEIYNKVVLQKSQIKEQVFESDDKENLVLTRFSPTRKHIMFEEMHPTQEDETFSQHQNSSFSSLSAHPYQHLPPKPISNNYPLNQSQMSMAHSHNRSGLYLNTPQAQSINLEIPSVYNQQASTVSLQTNPQYQLQETLKTLNETAMQLRQACQGISQFTSNLCKISNSTLDPYSQTSKLSDKDLMTPREQPQEPMRHLYQQQQQYDMRQSMSNRKYESHSSNKFKRAVNEESSRKHQSYEYMMM